MYKMEADKKWLIENGEPPVSGNAIVLGVTLPAVSYQPEEFGASQVITARADFLNEKIGEFLVPIIDKLMCQFSYGKKPGMEIYKQSVISLPTISNTIAFSYMENYINLLEEERLVPVKTYLQQSGLNDTTLTQEEKSALEKFRSGEIEWKEFRIGELLEKVDAVPLPFNKREKNAVVGYDKTHTLPLINAKFGDNGVMYYGKENCFKSFSNVIAVVYDGAIAAGSVYAHKDPVGIYSHSYLIQSKQNPSNFSISLFYKTAIEKCIYPKYSRDNAAHWSNKVENDAISLPVTADGIDFAFMEHFIKAIEKNAVRGIGDMLNQDIKNDASNFYDNSIPDYYIAAEPEVKLKKSI